MENKTDEWEVCPDHVTRLEILGQGAFGKVYRAILKTTPPREEVTILAKLKGTSLNVKKTTEIIAAVKTLNGIKDRYYLEND